MTTAVIGQPISRVDGHFRFCVERCFGRQIRRGVLEELLLLNPSQSALAVAA